jgi:hypothetical protein
MSGSLWQKRLGKWLVGGVLAGASFIAAPEGMQTAAADAVIDVQIAPPARRVEVVPARPTPRHVWVPGYWAWNGRHHVWVAGHYALERPGYAWREPRWEDRGRGHWHFHRGGWYRR